MNEKNETRVSDIIQSYRDQLDSYREKLAWVKDYL